MKHLPPYFLVIDCESMGLHGETFAAAGVVIDTATGKELRHFNMHTDREGCACYSIADAEWVDANVTIREDSEQHDNAEEMRMCFLAIWQAIKRQFPGVAMAAECAWPVEANFLKDVVGDNKDFNKGPYPLHEIASFMAAAGLDPMGTHERLVNEQPAHEPLADARQSARLLLHSISVIRNNGRMAEAHLTAKHTL